MDEQRSPYLRRILGRRIGQTSRGWRRAVDRQLQPFGLTEATWMPLTYVARAPAPMRQKDLAESICIDGSSLVRLLDALDQAGLIERQTDDDRRAKLIKLTQCGGELFEKVEAAMTVVREQILSGISDEELETTLNVLDRICSALDTLGSSATEAVE